MNDVLERRVVELETRLAFQEQALAEISEALAVARLQSTCNAELLRHALDEMRQVRSDFHADLGDEPPPPHY